MSLKRNILDLRKRKEIVLQGGGEDAIKKQAAMGKLTARERIEGILDKGSFHEYDMFVEHQSKDFDMDKKSASRRRGRYRYRYCLWRTRCYLCSGFHCCRRFVRTDARP
mgnify:CR=1 FL=1